VEPRFPWLTAFCLVKAGEKPASLPWFKRALDGVEALRDTVNQVAARTAGRIAGETVRIASDFQDDAMLKRAYELYVLFRTRKDWADKPSSGLALYGPRDPVILWARRLIERREFGELFKVLKMSNGRLFFDPRELQKEVVAAATMEKFNAAALQECSAPSDHLFLARLQVDYFGSKPAAVAVLERARERHKTDLQVHFELARHHVQAGEWDKAFATAREGVEAATTNGPELERLVLYAARLAAQTGKPAAGAEILKKALRVVKPERVASWAEACRAVGDLTSALRFYRAAEEAEEMPNGHLAAIYFEEGRLELALKYANRHRRIGTYIRGWPMDEDLPSSPATSPEQIRAAILEKLGQDFFIDRFLQQPAAAKDEEKALVERLLARLDGGLPEERVQAREELLKLDPRLGSLLKPGLAAKDGWTQMVVREVLSHMAEPQ
jgi:tetratricopeptide (TPR) repeat protein